LSSFIHNFFDGFAIGVAFASRDRATYVPVIVAVFVHEIPRELGDVGVLIKNGFSGIQTILCNGFINFMSLLGVILGLGLVSIS
jgi:zinc and cadmium transporter